MSQGQQQCSENQSYIRILGRSQLLQRHPILTPVLLLGGSVLLSILGFSNDAVLFPLLALVGVSSSLLCLSIAFVFGVAGILAGIIGAIEYVDRYSLQAAMFPKPKEHSYANRN